VGPESQVDPELFSSGDPDLESPEQHIYVENWLNLFLVFSHARLRRENNIAASVGDPWHFGADPDPDPRIRVSD
jgi:hypothetical protein